MKTTNQFQLFGERRYLPYFITQFLGAFNDNIYRISLMVLIATTYAKTDVDKADYLVNVCAALFILPFFLFSATAGNLADKYDKTKLIRLIKMFEVLVMSMVGLAFYFDSMLFLIAILFLTGTQSSFFGPIKFSILPEHLEEDELVGGNGLVEMGTFVAILMGTVVGGTLIALDDKPKFWVSVTTLFVALVGFSASMMMPRTKVNAPDLKINWNPIRQTIDTLKTGAQRRSIFLSILGISWFWFYGTCFLTQLPNYNERFLNGDEHVITALLATFSIGIGLGSILCERLSGHKVEIGLVPFGAIGLTLFAVDLSFAHGALPEQMVTVQAFLQNSSNWRLLADLFFMGIFGGFYIVPLYVILQDRSDPKNRSRVIAANNIMNALFMSIASIFTIALLVWVDVSIPTLFFIIGIMNFVITLYIFSVVPEFLLRFIAWVIVSLLYRVDLKGIENIPDKGPCVICSNHVSYFDPVLMMAVVKRPIRFVMDHRIFKVPGLNFFFKHAGCIPIAPAKEDASVKEDAFKKVAEYLDAGEVVGIYPEGHLSADGSIRDFRPGIERVIESNPVVVIPVALRGMWGSWFSRKHGKAMMHIPRKFIFAKVGVHVGKAIQPNELDRQALQKTIEELRGDNP